MAIQASFYVKIAGPENDVYMYEFICPESVQKQSPRTLSDPTMVTQRLAALRSHGSRLGFIFDGLFSFRFELFVSRESISFFSLLRSFPMTVLAVPFCLRLFPT